MTNRELNEVARIAARMAEAKTTKSREYWWKLMKRFEEMCGGSENA